MKTDEIERILTEAELPKASVEMFVRTLEKVTPGRRAQIATALTSPTELTASDTQDMTQSGAAAMSKLLRDWAGDVDRVIDPALREDLLKGAGWIDGLVQSASAVGALLTFLKVDRPETGMLAGKLTLNLGYPGYTMTWLAQNSYEEALFNELGGMLAAQPAGSDTARRDRQQVVVEWGERCFGAEHMADKIARSARFIEEAAELVQAAGLPKDHLQRVVDHVYSRELGDIAQEVGGAANTLMALCGALGLSFDECQRVEIERCLAKEPTIFAARNEEKKRLVDASPEQPSRREL